MKRHELPKIDLNDPKYKRSTAHLMQLCDALDFDPFEELIKFAKGDEPGLNIPVGSLDVELRLKAVIEANKYINPQLKSIELKGDPENPIEHRMNVANDVVEKLAALARTGHFEDLRNKAEKEEPGNDDKLSGS